MADRPSNQRLQDAEHLLRQARMKLPSDWPQDQYLLKLIDQWLDGTVVETKTPLPYLLSTYRSDDRVIIQCESVEKAEETLSRVMEWLHSLHETKADGHRVRSLEWELRRASHRFNWLADHHLTTDYAKTEARKLADEFWKAQESPEKATEVRETTPPLGDTAELIWRAFRALRRDDYAPEYKAQLANDLDQWLKRNTVKTKEDAHG